MLEQQRCCRCAPARTTYLGSIRFQLRLRALQRFRRVVRERLHRFRGHAHDRQREEDVHVEVERDRVDESAQVPSDDGRDRPRSEPGGEAFEPRCAEGADQVLGEVVADAMVRLGFFLLKVI